MIVLCVASIKIKFDQFWVQELPAAQAAGHAQQAAAAPPAGYQTPPVKPGSTPKGTPGTAASQAFEYPPPDQVGNRK